MLLLKLRSDTSSEANYESLLKVIWKSERVGYLVVEETELGRPFCVLHARARPGRREGGDFSLKKVSILRNCELDCLLTYFNPFVQ